MNGASNHVHSTKKGQSHEFINQVVHVPIRNLPLGLELCVTIMVCCAATLFAVMSRHSQCFFFVPIALNTKLAPIEPKMVSNELCNNGLSLRCFYHTKIVTKSWLC